MAKIATSLEAQAENKRALATAAARMGAVLRAGAGGGLKAMAVAGFEITNEARELMAQPGRGRVYVRAGRPPHRASAPGDPPASNSGRMLGAWFNELVTEPPFRGTLFVGNTRQYAAFTEFGTRNMLPRPALRPAIAKATLTMARRLSVAIVDAERGAVGVVSSGGLGVVI